MDKNSAVHDSNEHEQIDNSNHNTSDYSQQQCSRPNDGVEPKQRKVGRGAGTRKSRLKNEVYLPPCRRNRECTGSVDSANEAGDMKGKFEDVETVRKVDKDSDIEGALYSKHSDAKKSRLNKTNIETSISNTEPCKDTHLHRGDHFEEGPEILFDRDSTKEISGSSLSMDIDSQSVDSVQSQELQVVNIPQEIEQHSLNPSVQTYASCDSDIIEKTNSNNGACNDLPLTGEQSPGLGVIGNSELWDKMQPTNTDCVVQNTDITSENSVQVCQSSGKTVSKSENVDMTEKNFVSESPQLQASHTDCEENFEVNTDDIHVQQNENLAVSNDNQCRKLSIDGSNFQDDGLYCQTKTEINECSSDTNLDDEAGDENVKASINDTSPNAADAEDKEMQGTCWGCYLV